MPKGTNQVARMLLAASLTTALPVAFSQTAKIETCKTPSLDGEAKLPEFDVASIRPSNTSGLAGVYTSPGGKVTAGHLNVRLLLMFACLVPMSQIVGGPSWADTDFYNIVAKPPESSPSAKLTPSNPNTPLGNEQRQMLLALLMDRFQLKFHIEPRKSRVYLLERGHGEPKLNPPKDRTSYPWFGGLIGGGITPAGVTGNNISIAFLAFKLSQYLEHPVINETGIAGSFDLQFKIENYDPDAEYTKDDVVSAIFTSVRGVGLKLRLVKGTIETIVIDQIEKPSPN
jgi:uncharacterized protein (TIGR03435 family)